MAYYRLVRPSAWLSFAVVLVNVVLGARVFAQEKAPQTSVATDEAPLVDSTPSQIAAAGPSRTPVAITATCALGEHDGLADNEARTGADVICHELARTGASHSSHEIRFGKLGGKTLVTVASRTGNLYDERRTLLGSMDELPVAAPRLVGALTGGRSIEETKTVDNVLSSETRPTKVHRGQMGADIGLFGMTSLGEASGTSGGVEVGLLYRAGRLGVSGSGRAGGIGSARSKLGTASLSTGVRWYLSNADVSPFLGVGLELAYVGLSRANGSDVSGSGIGAYGVVGVQVLRSHHASLIAALRVDAPLFLLRDESSSTYAVPLSLGVGMSFH